MAPSSFRDLGAKRGPLSRPPLQIAPKKFTEPVALSSAPPTDVSASAYSSSGGASTYSRSVLAARGNLGAGRAGVKSSRNALIANCAFFFVRGRNCDPRLLDHKKFSEPGALSSPDPTNFRLPPTASRIGLDLLASRARCKREARASAGERQGRRARRVRKLRLFLYTMACLRIASNALAVNWEGSRARATTEGGPRGTENLCCASASHKRCGRTNFTQRAKKGVVWTHWRASTWS